MHSRSRGLAAVLAGAVGLSTLALGIATPAHAAAADLQITEIAYGGKGDKAPGLYPEGDGEYIEVTNVGDAPQSLAGWSYAANKSVTTPTAGVVDLSSLGTIAPGESFLITDLTADHFRAEWALKASVKVINDGSQTVNGGPDRVAIFDGSTLVDSLGYAAGYLSAKGVAAFADAGHLGETDTAASGAWTTPATTSDAEGSWTSAGGAVGSPGASTFGTSTPAGVRVGTTPPVDPPAVDPNWSNITINEVSSDNATDAQKALGDPFGDAIELYNKGSVAVDLAGWKQIDSGAASAATTFGPIYVNGSTTAAPDLKVPAHGYAVFASTKGLGSGGDSVKLYLPDGTLVDSLTYAAGEAGLDEVADPANTYKAVAACPDGSHTYLKVTSYSFGAGNATACATGHALGSSIPVTDVPCTTEAPGPTTDPVTGAAAWPGSSTVAVADQVCAWDGGGTQQDLSGLVFDPTDPSVLWAVKNKSVVYKLTKADGLWQKVTTDGWAGGKALTFPGGTGLPDSEGMTVGPDGALYITTERDNAANKVPHDSILRFDPSGSATTLVATDEWNLTSDVFPAGESADANLGFEGVTYVPDSFLTASGFVDESTQAPYRPSAYPAKVTAGLFFGAVEKNGHLRAYALNNDHSFTRVADIATGMAGVMEVAYDADLKRLWAQCDNTCGVNLALLKVGADGHIVPEKQFARPAGLPNNNLEGFAIAPVSTATDGTREVLWSDDGNFGTSTTGVSTIAANGGHSLWRGRMNIDLGLAQTVTITSTSPASPVVGGSYTPTTASTGGDAPVLLGATGSCSLASGVVSFRHAGTCTVTADKAASPGFAAAPQASQTIAVVAAKPHTPPVVIGTPGHPAAVASATAPKSIKARKKRITVSFKAVGAASKVVNGRVAVYDGKKKIGTFTVKRGTVVITFKKKLTKGKHKLKLVLRASATSQAKTLRTTFKVR